MNMKGSAAQVNLYGGRERRDAQRRRANKDDVPFSQLYSEISRGADYFWSQPHRTRPDYLPMFQKWKTKEAK